MHIVGNFSRRSKREREARVKSRCVRARTWGRAVNRGHIVQRSQRSTIELRKKPRDDGREGLEDLKGEGLYGV